MIEPLSEQSALITISDESTTTSNSMSETSSDITIVNGDMGACNPAASFLVETLVLVNRMAMALVFVVICFLMNGSVKHVAGIQVQALPLTVTSVTLTHYSQYSDSFLSQRVDMNSKKELCPLLIPRVGLFRPTITHAHANM